MGELLLISGGLDSTALAALRRPDICLHIDYGHRASRGERTAAAAVAEALGLRFTTLDTDCSAVGAGLLAGLEPSSGRAAPEWWPYRNQLLVTLAGGWAVARGHNAIVLGTITSDGERHIDGTEAFYECIDNLMAMQEGAIRVLAPAIHMTTAELIAASGVGDDVLGWTHSCHTGDLACGRCPGCVKRHDVLTSTGRLV